MIKRELKINFKSLIIWLGIMMFIFGIVFLVYPSIINSENAKDMHKFMELFPPEVLATFNMDLASIDSVFGWFQTEGFVLLALLGGLYSATLGGTILIKEESDKTIEFLVSKPISKNKIVTSKIVVGVINITLFVILNAIFTFIGFKLSDDLHIKKWLLITVGPIIVFYSLFFISMLASTFMNKSRKSMTISLAIVLLGYFLQTISKLSDKIEWLKYISPFELFDSRLAIANTELSISRTFIGIGIIFTSGLLIYYRYNKKELVI